MLYTVKKFQARLLSKYISRDPLLKVFMAKDVIDYSYEFDNIVFYFLAKREVKQIEDIEGVALCIDKIHLYFSTDNNIDIEDYLHLIKIKDPALVQAPCKIMERIYNKSEKDGYYYSVGEAALFPIDKKIHFQEDIEIHIATAEDIPGLCLLNNSLEGDKGKLYSYENKEKYEMKLLDGDGRIYCVKSQGKIVSMAETAFEKAGSGFICDVCTHPLHRKMGYVTAIIKKLVYDMQKEGMSVGIAYEEMRVGDIYKGIGFTKLGDYASMEKNVM